MTGIPASTSPISLDSPPGFHHQFQKSSIRSYSAAIPRPIPARNYSSLSTPPLTPDDGSDSSVDSFSSPIKQAQPSDAFDFLVNLFPRHGMNVLSYAKKVSLLSPTIGATFEGVVLELPSSPKTLYVDGKSAESVSLRERLVLLCFTFKTLLHNASFPTALLLF